MFKFPRVLLSGQAPPDEAPGRKKFDILLVADYGISANLPLETGVNWRQNKKGKISQVENENSND